MLDQEAAHAAGFELEHAVRLALGDHIVHGLIVQRDILGLAYPRPRARMHVERVADDGQRAQTQEIHLQQAQLFDGAHRDTGW